MELQVFNTQGQSVKKVTVSDDIFGVDMNEAVLHSVIKAYQANRRQGTHQTKTRSMVSGGGKKPWKQKGTGGARGGSSRSSTCPGGGQNFGPQPRDYRQHINKKTKQLALRIALSDKARHGKIIVISDFKIEKHNTKHVVSVLKTLKVGKALLSDERKDDLLYKSTRNIYGAEAIQPTELNAENILRYESLVVSETALTSLQQRFAEKAGGQA